MKTMKCVVCALIVCCMLSAPVLGSSEKMKGPGTRQQKAHIAGLETTISSVDIALLGAIRFYRNWISPIGGENRCGFRPTCSAYGFQTLEEQGAATGILMTADRLIRCNIWKEAGPDYTLLPNGKLFDPPSKNLLREKTFRSPSLE